MFKIGDTVKTIFGEIGTIASEWPYHESDNDFDWWVDITFNFGGKTYTMREMYRNSELIGV